MMNRQKATSEDGLKAYLLFLEKPLSKNLSIKYQEHE
ncbi:hypothetical protein JGUZn3_12350 [Entomobacter blattae]|uniref:Uncharacterized protein n=1 Tax=Entomobacter blattae TaxID=2762277 RepID=A0A7H1NRQ1_9PROT|nr:hypothetical protein JGUZn3_12350 [Entomobacter blattae]